MAHVEQLVPLVHRTLAAAGARSPTSTGSSSGLGPGPFTGLRVGIVTAQVLAHVRGVALHGVCSLDVIAARPTRSGRLLGPSSSSPRTRGARRSTGRATPPTAPALEGRRSAAPTTSRACPTVGPGADLYADRLDVVAGPRTLDAGPARRVRPRPAVAGTEPLYLRRPDAAEPARRKSVLRLPPGQAVRR